VPVQQEGEDSGKKKRWKIFKDGGGDEPYG